MKLLLKIFLSLLVVVILLLLAGLFLPDKVDVRRSVVMKASPSAVFNQVNSLRRFSDWSPWSQIDTTAQYTFTGEEGVGSYLTWESDHRSVGSGKMTITESIPCEKVTSELVFDGESESAYASFLLSETEEGTEVTWTMESELGNNPVNRYVGWFISKGIGEQYEQGLATLQEAVEKKAIEISIPIEEVDMPDRRAIGVHSAAPTYYDLEAPMQEAFAQLGAYLRKNRITPSSPFISVYLSEPETGSVRFFSGLGSNHEVSDASAPVQVYTVPAGPYVKAVHTGSYDGVDQAHAQIGAYLEANGLQVVGPVWDEYVISAPVEPDPTKWVTNIYYPVAEACAK